MNTGNRTAAIILAAGIGSRMKMAMTKQKYEILGKSVLRRSVEAFEDSPEVDTVVVVTREDELEFAMNECSRFTKVKGFVLGGSSRAQSAKNGFESIKENADYVMIHDAARCLITCNEVTLVARAAYEYGAATASCPVTDSVKTTNGRFIEADVPRDTLRTVQTPQAFSTSLYQSALDAVQELDKSITDDNSLVARVGASVYFVDTEKYNIKITTPEDVRIAEFILAGRETELSKGE